MGFVLEARFCVGIEAECSREKLECYGAFEAGVLGFVDDTHAAFAELLNDLIVGYCLADHETPTRACMIPAARGANFASVRYGRGGRESIVARSEGLYVVKPFRPLLALGQWMRVFGKKISLTDDHDEFVKGLAPGVDVL